MPTGTTTYGDISQRTAAWAATKMLEHAEPILVLQKFAETKEMPKNKADTVKFRRPKVFTVNTTPLTEGIQPSGHKIVYEDVIWRISQHGDFATITDKVQDLAEDPVLSDMSMLSGEQAAETMEMLLYGSIKGGTTVFYGASTDNVRADVNDAISLNRLRAVSRRLQLNRAKKITQMMSSSVNYGTKAIEAAYIMFAHTDLESDIRNLEGFKVVADYGSRQPLCPEELGSIENFRVICSPLLSPFTDAGGTFNTHYNTVSTSGVSSDVYPIIFTAKHAYGSLALKGKGAIAPMVLNPGIPRSGDRLGQVGSVGWKAYHAGGILNDAWLVRLEVAAKVV